MSFVFWCFWIMLRKKFCTQISGNTTQLVKSNSNYHYMVQVFSYSPLSTLSLLTYLLHKILLVPSKILFGG